MLSILIPISTGIKLPHTEEKKSVLALHSFENAGLYELYCRY